MLLPTKKHWTNPIVHHIRCLPNTRACTRHFSTKLRKRTIVWNSAGYPTTSTADTKLCRSPDNTDAEVRTHYASVAPASLVADSSTDSIQSTCVDLLLCTAGQTGCLPWLVVVCMYHRRRSCRIAYGRHHVIVCVQSCVCSEGEHTLHISCCFGGRRQISLRLLY